MDLPSVEKTLALIKPDAVAKGKANEIMQLIEMAGFTIVMKQKLQVRDCRAHMRRAPQTTVAVA